MPSAKNDLPSFRPSFPPLFASPCSPSVLLRLPPTCDEEEREEEAAEACFGGNFIHAPPDGWVGDLSYSNTNSTHKLLFPSHRANRPASASVLPLTLGVAVEEEPRAKCAHSSTLERSQELTTEWPANGVSMVRSRYVLFPFGKVASRDEKKQAQIWCPRGPIASYLYMRGGGGGDGRGEQHTYF